MTTPCIKPCIKHIGVRVWVPLPPPRGGRDVRFPNEIAGFGPALARSRGGSLITIGTSASAERRVELDLGVEGGGGVKPSVFFTPSPAATPQDPCRSALEHGLVVDFCRVVLQSMYAQANAGGTTCFRPEAPPRPSGPKPR